MRFEAFVACGLLQWQHVFGSRDRDRDMIASLNSFPFPEQRATIELNHPGHAPVHVTRLHRYDHSGIDAFLQREDQWQRMETQVDEPRSFLQISEVQAVALNDHHEAFLQESTSNNDVNGKSSHQGAAAQYLKKSDVLTRPSPSETTVLQRFAKVHTGLHDGRAVTGLSSLMSQYVGPIGVGTTLTPSGCQLPSNASNLQLKVDFGTEPSTSLSQDGTQDCQMTDQSKIWVVFDTGSTNIWIASDLCETGACMETGRQRYNHTKSLSFAYPDHQSTLTVQFGTGKLIGPQARDDLHIGPFTVFNQTFAMIETQNGQVFHDVPFEGILGLAFPAMSANKVKPFFDTVIEQKALEKNEFAIYFSRDVPSANAVFWGGVDKRFCDGEIEYFPVTDPYYWAMDLHAFKIGDECLFGPGCSPRSDSWLDSVLLQTNNSSSAAKDLKSIGKVGYSREAEVETSTRRQQHPKAVVDTGTTYFTAEGDLFGNIMARIPPSDCNLMTEESHKNLTYTLRNVRGDLRDFVFSRHMYMTSGAGSTRCSPAFMKIDIPAVHGPGMVLGEVFLRNYYAVFDRGSGLDADGRVGFAPSVHSDNVRGHIRELTHSQPSFQESRSTALSNLQQRSTG